MTEYDSGEARNTSRVIEGTWKCNDLTRKREGTIGGTLSAGMLSIQLHWRDEARTPYLWLIDGAMDRAQIKGMVTGPWIGEGTVARDAPAAIIGLKQ